MTDAASAAPSAVVLLSGGLDSATCLALALEAGFTPVALSFRYGQRHAVELDAAALLAASAGVEHVVADLDLRVYGGSALTADLDVPKHHSVAELAAEGIPITYVPARNTVFLAHALALAEVRGAADVFIGVNAVDYSGYPDCRPEFIARFEALANVAIAAATEHGRRLTIHAPLQLLSKGEIVAQAVRLGVELAATISCYDPRPDGAACGHCDSCLLRAQGFADAGIPDPTRYADVSTGGPST